MSAARTVRRVLTVPAVVALHLVVLAGTPLAAVAAGIAGLGQRSTRPLRSVVLVASVSALELVTLSRIARLRAARAGQPDWQQLLCWVAGCGEATIRRVLDVRLEAEAGSATADEVRAADGLVVLARHAGPGDSVLVAWLLVVAYGLRLQIVLKQLLRVVPSIDLAGDVLPLCFVGPGTSARDRIAALAGRLGRGDALLLFPEGGNFSAERRRRGLARLASSGAVERLRRLRRNEHTLPPHVGGVEAALLGAPRASVLLVAHSGLGEHGDARPWWRLPVHQVVAVRTLLVPAEQVPRDSDAVAAWLDRMWSCVDTWVEGNAALDELEAGPAAAG